MKQLWQITLAEWQYWRRSHLIRNATLLFLGLVITTGILTSARVHEQNHARAHQQTHAENTFKAQPDRHPHRMVHYGHYVFRNAAPLAVFDPGLDAVTGQSIFLEGHRQNSATFAESAASANVAGLSWLSPALIYQVFAPLLLILLGHSAITRERESAVLVPLLSMGITGCTLLAGKALALILFSGVLLTPLAINGAITLLQGETLAAVATLITIYAIYLTIWVCITLCMASVLHKRATVLAALAGMWFSLILVLPSVAVNIVTYTTPADGKIQTDLRMLADIRKLGDGHNANDPAFAKMRADLLKKHNVTSVDDLPLNFRGKVAFESEKKLTHVLNNYAAQRQQTQQTQTHLLTQFGWLTPTMSIALASRAIAGTDLRHYHRFENEAEALRYDFVQGLNSAHQTKLSYQDDINRNKDEYAWQRARVDANNWQVLDSYAFTPASTAQRIQHAATALSILAVWLIGLLALLILCARRIQP